jgi:hypothetical protein
MLIGHVSGLTIEIDSVESFDSKARKKPNDITLHLRVSHVERSAPDVFALRSKDRFPCRGDPRRHLLVADYARDGLTGGTHDPAERA